MDDYPKHAGSDNATSALLRFKDRELESQFWEETFASRKKFIDITILITIIAIIGTSGRFLPYISYTLPKSSLDLDFTARVTGTLPLIVAFILNRFGIRYAVVQSTLLIAGLYIGLSFSTMMFLSGTDGVTYYNYAFIHVLVYLFVFTVIPISKIIYLTSFLILYHLFVSYRIMGAFPPEKIMFTISPTITLSIILCYAGYSMEFSHRTNFILKRALNNEFNLKLIAQGQRSKWLGQVTDFLRHELKNSIIGVSSSLELIKRKNKNDEIEKYIHRAGNSASFMKRLLDEASTSTSLEATLNEINIKRINVSSLLKAKTDEYCEIYSDQEFDIDIEDNLYGSFDSDRLIQALDKLVNNAIEHCDQAMSILIRLREVDKKIEIKISNYGDTLKDDIDVFQAFVSSNSSRADGHFGLGLFVVKRIVDIHGGEITAKGLKDPDGAEFTASFPLTKRLTPRG
jgi:signal transduction histidine kinase